MSLKLLLLVAPRLSRVAEHLLADLDLRVVGRPENGIALVRQSERRQPDLILIDLRLLGRESLGSIAAAKRASPGSKTVLIRHSLERRTRLDGVDVQVAEESLVRTLRATLRRLGKRNGHDKTLSKRLEPRS